MNPRIRRLHSDYEKLLSRFQEWPRIVVLQTRGDPPDFYLVQYNVRGLARQMDGRLVETSAHVMEVNLNLQYPRRAPTCKITTPIFHPNIDASSVCIGDFWAPSEALDSLIIRIGRMIAYQEYNVKSPLDGIAARWAAENVHLLPVDADPVEPPMSEAPETGHAISIVEEMPAPAPDDPGAAAPPENHPGNNSWAQADEDPAPSLESLESLIVIKDDEPAPLTLTLPSSLEFIDVKVRCKTCTSEMRVESGVIQRRGFSCPNCHAFHQLG